LTSVSRRVVFVNRFFYPDESATSQILTDLARHLDENGWAVSIITGRYGGSGKTPLPRAATINATKIARVWSMHQGNGFAQRALSFATFYPAAFLAMIRVLRRGDILVTKTDPALISVVGMLAAKCRGAIHLNWLQDLYPEVAARLGAPVIRGRVEALLTWLRDKSLRAARVNVAIGARMQKLVEARTTGTSRTVVIPNWADEQTIVPIDPLSSQSREAWGITKDQFVLGYSGNLGKAHESQTLFEAAQLLKDRRDIIFLFVGGGAELRALQMRVERSGLENFIFASHQPRELLSDSLGAADVHWLSLRPELEGLIVPSKVYGILAAGRPVLAVTDMQGEIAAIIEAYGCGLVVQPGDPVGLARSIGALADDPEQRRGMGERARLASEQALSKKAALNKWSDLLEQVATDQPTH
jgi:glycosyltransferase involved in cell wall biosynthesis